MIISKIIIVNFCEHYKHSPTGAPAPAKLRPFLHPPGPGETSQRPGGVRRGLPIFTREGATQEQW